MTDDEVIDATKVTVEYEFYRGSDCVVLVPFPPKSGGARILITGSLEDLRALIDSMSGLLDDLENE